MDSTNLLHTHIWSRTSPRQLRQDGDTIFLRQCLRCGRDFAQGLGGSDWCAVHLGAFKVELLADKPASERWLKEECPKIRLPADDVARGIVRG